MPPRAFRLDVPQPVLDDLRQRLVETRWPAPLPGHESAEYGADVSYIKRVCDYWAHTYDWRAQEAKLNRYPMFLCEVDGIDLHYWHVRGKGPAAFPLLLVHGWPGSIVEFYSLIERLTDPEASGGDPADAFDVVIPALPGYGFSGQPKERGWGISRTAEAFDRLMHGELGYARYGVQGGDWGGITVAKLASLHPEHVAGLHLNYIRATPPTNPSEEDEAIMRGWRETQGARTAHRDIQRTKPDSLTVALTDSPAGLAAWIVRAFADYGEEAFALDNLITNLMLYWLPGSTASAARYYFEARMDHGEHRYPWVPVPTAFAHFPREMNPGPRRWAEERFNIQRWTEMSRGGHFAAFEQPDLLLADVRAFFATIRAGEAA